MLEGLGPIRDHNGIQYIPNKITKEATYRIPLKSGALYPRCTNENCTLWMSRFNESSNMRWYALSLHKFKELFHSSHSNSVTHWSLVLSWLANARQNGLSMPIWLDFHTFVSKYKWTRERKGIKVFELIIAHIVKQTEYISLVNARSSWGVILCEVLVALHNAGIDERLRLGNEDEVELNYIDRIDIYIERVCDNLSPTLHFGNYIKSEIKFCDPLLAVGCPTLVNKSIYSIHTYILLYRSYRLRWILSLNIRLKTLFELPVTCNPNRQ